jgi:hypothetical protein
VLYDDEFYDSLPDDPLAVGKAIVQKFVEFDRPLAKSEEENQYQHYVESFAVMKAFCETFGLATVQFALTGDKRTDIEAVQDIFGSIDSKIDISLSQFVLEQTRKRFDLKFGLLFSYTFSDGDLDRIQTLINELRERITAASFIPPEHKNRLLKKLESLQTELHKRVPSLDRFWGVVGDAGVVLGKFGNDAKPLFDRFKEIAQIVWRTQARAEELPSGARLPLLSAPDKDEESSE